MTRVPHLARQAISTGTQKFHVLHITFVMIHTEGILTLTLYKSTYVVGTLNDLKPLSRHTVSKRLPIPAVNQAQRI